MTPIKGSSMILSILYRRFVMGKTVLATTWSEEVRTCKCSYCGSTMKGTEKELDGWMMSCSDGTMICYECVEETSK